MAWFMANERRERCRELGRVDQSSGEDDERKLSYNTLDVKTVAAESKGKNLLVNESAVYCDAYVLVEQLKRIKDGEYKIHGWASREHVKSTPVGEVQEGCHFLNQNELLDLDYLAPTRDTR